MKKVILKLTGELIQHTEAGLDIRLLEGVARQVKELAPTIQFGIVMGGGNFYRGAQERTKIREAVGHYVGMLATMMNGLIIQEVFESTGISTKLFLHSLRLILQLLRQHKLSATHFRIRSASFSVVEREHPILPPILQLSFVHCR